LAEGKCTKIYFSQAAFSIISQDHRQTIVCNFRVKITALESLERVVTSKLVSNFKGVS
jgi:hypothetical protein